MRNFIWLILFSPFFVYAQDGGIAFSQNSTWEEILQRAKAEHKYIFVDCYATWCGPCKVMDEQIYPNDIVGQFMNDKFISVKIQMDSTSQDLIQIKSWYGTAHAFEKQYMVNEYPSFLFFSSDGLILHKGIGAKPVNNFLDMVKAAMNSQEQFYTLLDLFEKGNLNFSEMPHLADESRKLGMERLAAQIAEYYIQNFIESLPEEQMWTKENLDFIQAYPKSFHSNDKAFQLYFRDRLRIDSIGKYSGYADGLINTVIYADEITPNINASLEQHIEPEWKKIEGTIRKKYDGAYVKKNILKGRVIYYKAAREWHNYAKYLVIRYENAGIMKAEPGFGTFVVLNNNAFEVFKYSNNKKELKTALRWVDRALTIDSTSADALDTKANILYKLGKKEECLPIETRSVSLSHNKDYQANLVKMKDGQPTWPN